MSNPYDEALGRTPRAGKPPKKRLHPSQKRAKKQERETAVRFGGTSTLASGSKDEKGDVRVRRIARIECKTTKNKSFKSLKTSFAFFLNFAPHANSIPSFKIKLFSISLGNGGKLFFR